MMMKLLRLHLSPRVRSNLLAVFGLISLAALVIASISLVRIASASTQASAASRRAAAVANCVNDALANRQKVSDTPALLEESQADADWSRAVLTLFSLPRHPTPAQAKAETADFLKATQAYAQHKAHAAAVLSSNAAYRAAHPLGRC